MSIPYAHNSIFPNKLRILLVEDSDEDAGIFERILARYFPKPMEILRVGTLEAAKAALEEERDLSAVLLDLGLPDSSDPEDTYRHVSPYGEQIPIIVLTCMADHDLALNILDIGGGDYVIKNSIIDQPLSLCLTIEYAIGRHISNRQKQVEMETALSEKDNLLQLVTGSYSVTH